MFKKLKYVSILLMTMMLMSCGEKNVIFDESVVINNSSWNNQDKRVNTKEFNYLKCALRSINEFKINKYEYFNSIKIF